MTYMRNEFPQWKTVLTYFNLNRQKAFLCYTTVFLIFVLNIQDLLRNLYNISFTLRVKDTTNKENIYSIVVYTIPSEPDLSIGRSLRSIIYNTKYINTANQSSPISTCSPTSQIRITVFQHGNDRKEKDNNLTIPKLDNMILNTTWIIEALDEQGNRKTVGGDEFFIRYIDYIKPVRTPKSHPHQATAIVVDNQDGTYTLDFVDEPLLPFPVNIAGIGNLTINFSYTCGIERMTRPSKDNWNNGGSLRRRHTLMNVIAPPIRAHHKPNTLPNGTKIVDFSKFDYVIFFGDSQLNHMCGTCNSNKDGRFCWPEVRPNPPNMYSPRNMGENIGVGKLEKAFKP